MKQAENTSARAHIGKGDDHDGAADEAFESRWRARFREFAEEREDDAGIAGWSRAGLDARVRQFLQVRTRPRAGTCWLDAGCGAGTYTRILRDQGLVPVGTDYSFPTLRKAMQRETGPAMYATADVRCLPFADATFDGVLCFGVMQALSRSDEAVDTLARVTRPGGEVWVDALNRWCIVNLYDIVRRRVQGRRMHLRYESPRVMKQLMRSSGLREVRLHWLPLLPGRFKGAQHWVETPLARWVFRFVPFAGLLLCHSFIVVGMRQAERRDRHGD